MGSHAKRDFSPRRCGTCSNCGPTLCSSIPCAFWFAHDSNDPVDPSSVPVGSRSKPLFVAYTNSVNNVVPAVFATGAEFVRWRSDLGMPVTSALPDSVMKSLRTGRTVRLWIDWDIPVPIHRADFPRAVAVFCSEVDLDSSCLDLDGFGISLDFVRYGLLVPKASSCCSRLIIQIFWNFNDCSRTEFRSMLEVRFRLFRSCFF